MTVSNRRAPENFLKHSIKPGEVRNPKGMTRGYKHFKTILMDAIRAVEKKKHKSLFKHFIERAYEDDDVLIALMRKLLPDMSEVENTAPSIFNFSNLEDYEIDILLRKTQKREESYPGPARERIHFSA